jgi:hypothetical protein
MQLHVPFTQEVAAEIMEKVPNRTEGSIKKKHLKMVEESRA